MTETLSRIVDGSIVEDGWTFYVIPNIGTLLAWIDTGTIVIAAELELPSNTLLMVKVEMFPIIDRFPVTFSESFRDMIFIEEELPC